MSAATPDGAIDLEAARLALRTDTTIDIVTTGARTSQTRTTEIWFTNVEGRIIITGTIRSGRGGPLLPRDWLANLTANPEFLFCFKESIATSATALAHPVDDPIDRRSLMTARATQWYRDQGDTIDELVADAPIVDVEFTGGFAGLNQPREGAAW